MHHQRDLGHREGGDRLDVLSTSNGIFGYSEGLKVSVKSTTQAKV
jgi:hypothetical protein